MAGSSGADVQREALSDVASQILEECRMVLPGIQALFGFQLIAVFNEGFEKKLTFREQVLHLVAIALVTIAAALVLAPASYQRQAEPEQVSRGFVTLATRLLLWSMIPLAAGICLDFYLIAKIILHQALLSLLLTVALAGVFFGLWFLLPRLKVHRKMS